jgi:hypothetical protein
MKNTIAGRLGKLATLALFLSAPSDGVAAECAARSSSSRTALVEIYTSQGCDSCPPADRWLSSLTARGEARDRIVAMALHVDYWDRLGWRDPFGHPDHSRRQREAAKRGGSNTIYTPQVLINGRDFRSWSHPVAAATRLGEIQASAPGANIALASQRHAGRIDVRGTVEPALARSGDPLDAYLVLLQSGVLTSVASGENRGRTLRNDFVARAIHGPLTVHGSRPLAIAHSFDVAADAGAAGYSIASYVENRRTGEVLQALALRDCT